MRIESGLFYIEVSLTRWDYDPLGPGDQEVLEPIVTDQAWGSPDESYIYIPLSLEDFPYPRTFENFMEYSKVNKTRILSVNIQAIEEGMLGYLTKGMSVKIVHPAIRVRVPYSPLLEEDYDIEVEQGTYIALARNGRRANSSLFTYTIPAKIATMRVRSAYYVLPESGGAPENIRYLLRHKAESEGYGGGYVFEISPLSYIRELIERKNK